MKNRPKAYILHGCCDRDEYYSPDHPSPSNHHWIPWLQKQLLMNGYECQTPDMPTPYAPDYDAWLRIFEALPVDETTTLIGHSCGCGFLLKWLNKSGAVIDKLVMVAPFLDPQRRFGNFLQCRLRPDLMAQAREIHVFYSADDPVGGIKETVDMVMEGYPSAKLHKFERHGHFTLSAMGEERFPELLKTVLG